MKLALNGALMIGTFDGANIEIGEHVGDDNIFIFGKTAAEVETARARGIDSTEHIAASPILHEALDEIASGVFSAAMDQGNSILIPHRKYLASLYVEGAVLEPFEDFGARWSLGLVQVPGFFCAADAGRKAVVRMLTSLPGTSMRGTADSTFLVLSPERRPDLLADLKGRGWLEVAAFGGEVRGARWMTASLIR